MDGLRVLDLLRHEISVRVLRQHPGQDQQAVERRPQLVRHVGQELGLVLGGQRQLLGLFLDERLRLLDLPVLALDLRLLLGQEARSLLQLLVGALQFNLLTLEQLLRLLQRHGLLLQALVGLRELLLTSLQLLGEGL